MFRHFFSMAALSVTFVCVGLSLTAEDKQNLFGLPAKSIDTGGCVMLCGGGKLPEVVYDEFVELAGGRNARIILILSAYPYDDAEALASRFSGWREYDVASFDFLDTDDPDEADNADFVAPLKRATGVWIAGGAQARLIRRYGGRKVESALRSVVKRGGIVAGYSAGAAVLSSIIIRDGSSAEANLDQGFGLLERAVVDTHFSQRGRHTRLLSILDEHPNLIGLGIDESSAVVIRQNHLRTMPDSRISIIVSKAKNQAKTIYQLNDGEEADVTLASSPSDNGEQTVELSLRTDSSESTSESSSDNDAPSAK